MRISRKSAVGRIRRRMARRVRSRGRSSLSARLEYGADYKQRVRPHVSHQRFDSIYDAIAHDGSNPAQLQVHNDYSVYRCAYTGEGAPSLVNIRSFGIVDVLVRDRWMTRYRYARLQKVVFTLKWQTPNPPRLVDVGRRVVSFDGTATQTVPPGPTVAYGPIGGVGGVTASEYTTNYPQQGLPYWQLYMFWDPEHRYDDCDPITLRRQGIPVKCTKLTPGKVIRWTNYPVRKSLGFTAGGAGIVDQGNNQEDVYASITTMSALVSSSGQVPAVWGPLRYDKRFYPTEHWVTKPIGAATALRAVGWRLTVVPPFWDGTTGFPIMQGRNDLGAWPYQYDLATAGYWLFRGDKWSSTFLAPAGSDPMDDDEFVDIDIAPEIDEETPPELPVFTEE